MKTSTMTLMILALMSFATTALAEDDYRFTGGGRTALLVDTMKLSDIDPAFDDLSPDGPRGGHHSGLFFLYNLRPYARVGFETLVGNSDMEARTTMSFQAAGPVAEFRYGTRYFVAGGIHVGAMIVNVSQRIEAESEGGVQTGTHYKDAGVFVAPYAVAGMTFGRHEVGLYVKQISVTTGEEESVIEAMGAAYGGVSWGVSF